MISIDTNVLVRLLTRDDEVQYAKTERLVRNGIVFVPETVLLETEWVLRFAYQLDRSQIHDLFTCVLGLENVKVDRPLVVHDALSWFQDGMDFADALHLGGSSHCEKLATFDRAFIKSAKDCSPCTVALP
jgi:predicted nucleic-acid-binding protein